MTLRGILSIYGGLVPLGLPHSSVQPDFILYSIRDIVSQFPENSNAHLEKYRLQLKVRCATIGLPFGEGGANPPRARRRDAQSTVMILTRSRIWGNAIVAI